MPLKNVAYRAKLAVRNEPYFEALATGLALGYRKTPKGAAWYVRFYDAGTQKKITRALGDLGNVTGAEQWDVAKKLAEDFAAHLNGGGSAETCTVRQVCDAYVRHLRTEKGDGPADRTAARFAHLIDKTLGDCDVSKLKPIRLVEWRQRIASRAPTFRPRGGKHSRNAPKSKRVAMSKATINRDMASLRAALNYGCDVLRATTSNAAWKKALQAIPKADTKREVYLSVDERARLVAACPEHFRPFVRALCALPLRPGVLSATRVSDFNQFNNTLALGTDKSHEPRRIPLPPATAALFKAQTKNKTPGALLFPTREGEQHTWATWGPLLDAAVKRAKIQHATLYTLRHSTITDLCAVLDLNSLAFLAGTSVAMIQSHYGHIQKDHVTKALATLAV